MMKILILMIQSYLDHVILIDILDLVVHQDVLEMTVLEVMVDGKECFRIDDYDGEDCFGFVCFRPLSSIVITVLLVMIWGSSCGISALC